MMLLFGVESCVGTALFDIFWLFVLVTGAAFDVALVAGGLTSSSANLLAKASSFVTLTNWTSLFRLLRNSN